MNPSQYYQESDLPTSRQRRRMWGRIEASLRPRTIIRVDDRRSFFWGMAAAFLLFFSAYGAYHALSHLSESERPIALRFDAAYRSAIAEFESVLPAAIRSDDPGQDHVLLDIQRQRIELLDTAIRELQQDMNRTDLSPLKRARLRQLYMLKLQALFDLIERGDTIL
ncbi:MAG: hypothetical protein HRF44_05630 [Ignavibacterium sp.]